ncbi:hypothetical protein IE077_001503 [Cardiosporidium cionae]|uniref:MPN domain-containing protein n=1 Tax=Cardiosporidium cionae TaxID=476202 RepID=A0ABQ7J5B1_9APIC|nr:hypothetical protein IE077_001503 [Cardiosporidium cionae]|eukprot:KAF8819182.1 hypothetical protein IE077_001503 [Cardiosporidium cionae]
MAVAKKVPAVPFQEENYPLATMSIHLADLPAIKMFMHAFRYPSHSVCGVVVGEVRDDNPLQVYFKDIIPLFHSHITAPMIRLGMELAEEYCTTSALEIVGFYHADSSGSYSHTSEPVLQCRQIIGKISTNYPKLIFCQLNLHSSTLDENSIDVFLNMGDWKQLETSQLSLSTALPRLICQAGEQVLHYDFFDLDDHLGSPKANPLNLTVSALVHRDD